MPSPTFLILMYHRIPHDPRLRDHMAVPLDDFAAQMAYLAGNRVPVLSLPAFVEMHRATSTNLRPRPKQKNPLPEHPHFHTLCQSGVILTFDDGYAATCDHVERILEQHNFTGTLFLTTSRVGQPLPPESSGEGCLTWGHLRRLRRLRVQAHTLHHPRLSRLATPQLRSEIRDCKAIIEHELGQAVEHFAYPYGGYTAHIRSEVAKAGYLSAAAVHRGPVTLHDDLFRLHRITVDGRDPMAVFTRKLATGFGSFREQIISRTRDLVFELPFTHDLVELRHARRFVPGEVMLR